MILQSPKSNLGLLAGCAIIILLFNFNCIYPSIILFIAIFVLRSVIGRRCPRCDRQLQQTEAIRNPDNAFELKVIWRCPHDDYHETETIKGDSGLFGAS